MSGGCCPSLKTRCAQKWRGPISVGTHSGVQQWAPFSFWGYSMPEVETDDLAVDWSNVLFVVGVSLAVCAAVLFVYPTIRARFTSAPSQEK